jgi:cytochrome c553
MATAGAHHAMTAGSIILLDVTKGIDGQEPITRLTPDAPFPESETVVLPAWHDAAPGMRVTALPPSPEAERWPGHCYRTPYPLSEKYFLAAYSFDSLIGEPNANSKNMFGLYLLDAWGNKELLYRDPEICSLWPMPLRPRKKPPELPSQLDGRRNEGTFLVQDVYRAWPPLPQEKITRLRIVQVLPKSTPHANEPMVGLAFASPGRQVLGTVPVEVDGSAWFHAPAGIALAFQALDQRGQAVQTMRSLTYLQPGENCGCIGCHEARTMAPPPDRMPRALGRPPSVIQPGPVGSKPFSYPLLVQPVLDRKCVSCHGRDKPAGSIILTGEPQGRYTVSYNTLAPRVPYSAWGGDFAKVNSLTAPDCFGARGSRMMKLLLAGHEKTMLTPEEIERLATWMDTNALFFGTFDPDDQARQQRGERIAGPKIE